MVAAYIIGGILILLAMGLVAVILSQTGKDKSLSSTLAGGSADTFFGKSGGSSKDKWLSRATIIGSVVFVVLMVVLTILLRTAG